MSKEFPKLRDIEIEKQIFHSSKSAISVEDENIKKILVLKRFPYSKNDSTLFIDYVNDVLLSSTNMHQISTDAWICKYLQRKQMHDQNLIKDYQLLKNTVEFGIWNKINNIMEKKHLIANRCLKKNI